MDRRVVDKAKMLRCMKHVLSVLIWLVLAGLGVASACPLHEHTGIRTRGGATDASVHHGHSHGANANEMASLEPRRSAEARSQGDITASTGNTRAMPHGSVAIAPSGHGHDCVGSCASHAACAWHCYSEATYAITAASPGRTGRPQAIIVPSIADLLGISPGELAALDRLRSRRTHDPRRSGRPLPREHRLQRVQRLTI